MNYLLQGSFIESCNCRVVCPCWVDDRPTEDHCAGFFAWTFDDESVVDDLSVAGAHIVVVTVHSDRRRGGESEAVIFVDDRLDKTRRKALVGVFSIDDPGRTDPVADLAPTLGTPIEVFAATISVEPTTAGVDVRVRHGESTMIDAVLSRTIFDQGTTALTLGGTALDREMGVAPGHVFTAHRAKRLSLHVATLPDASSDLVGRSGMTGSFRYDALLDPVAGGRRRVRTP